MRCEAPEIERIERSALCLLGVINYSTTNVYHSHTKTMAIPAIERKRATSYPIKLYDMVSAVRAGAAGAHDHSPQ